MVMIITVLFVLGLVFGSFVNALVWRLHEQAKLAKSKKVKAKKNLSIVSGRSMCVHCHHELAAKDLVPVYSWLSLGGKCRYCKKPISWQYPVVEMLTALLFVFSYLYWPKDLTGNAAILFIFWLIFLVGFMAMVVYDLRWFILPNKLIYPLFGLALIQVLLLATVLGGGRSALSEAFYGLLIGGGIFYVIFQISSGKWIGGGDVKLGALLGLIVGGPAASLLLLFIASLLGTLVAVPLMLTGKANRSTRIPFGPFLIAACVIVYLFGATVIGWYKHQALGL